MLKMTEMSRNGKDEVTSHYDVEEELDLAISQLSIQPSQESVPDCINSGDESSDTDSDLCNYSDSDDEIGNDLSRIKFGTLNVGQGFSKKLEHILSSCNKLHLDVLAVQEIGDPLNYSRMALDSGYEVFVCGQNKAGVGLLVKSTMVPYVRQVLKSGTDGRMIGILFEAHGKNLLVVSTYMPTGLDFVSGSDEKVEITNQLYVQMLRWCSKADQCVLLGDFNETMTALDRYSSSARSVSKGKWLQQLVNEEMLDVYRTLHPSEAGYTHFTRAVGDVSVKSRLDYIWTSGIDLGDIDSCQIDVRVQISHHRLLWCSIKSVANMHVNESRVVQRLPNLRTATDDQKTAMSVQFGTKIEENKVELIRLSIGGPHGMNDLADKLSTWAYEAASSHLKLTGGRPMKYKDTAGLQRRRKLLASIRSCAGRDAIKCRKLVKQASKYFDAPLPDPSDAGFADVIKMKRSETRHLIKLAQKKMKETLQDKWDVNRKAAIHQMMGQERPSVVTSIVDPVTKKLEVQPEKLKSILQQGFAAVFNCPDEVPAPNPTWFDEVYVKPRENIDASWYDGLMCTTNEEEVLSICSSCKYIVAPGMDKVSAGVWRVCVEQNESVRWAVTLLFNSCLRLRKIPESGKKSIIVPILKKPLGEKEMSNVRPISLQNAITKMVTKLLACRLGRILAANRILHPAQEGFLKGGASFKCIDTLLDIWEHAKETKSGCFNLFYDIRAAFDSVRKPDLLRALRRINMPDAFIQLVDDSLSDLTSSVRTVYGLTAEFAVKRSVRQGDPLSPLLFIIFIDALHAGLECNPLFGGAKDGYQIRSSGLCTASKGFADDTVAVSGTKDGLRRQNEWVHAFAVFNHLELHPDKTQLVGRESGTGDAMVNTDIEVAGKLVPALDLGETIAYVGVHMCMDLNWNKQVSTISASIGWYCHIALKNKLSVQRTVYFLNVYLLSKIEYGLRYVQTTREQVAAWDKSVVACICNVAGMARKMHPSAAAAVLGIRLPSQHEKAVKISEAFLRLNGDGDWSRSGQARWCKDLAGEVRAVRSTTNRLVHVNSICTNLGWSMRQVPQLDGRRGQWKECDNVPSGCATHTLSMQGKPYQAVFNYHGLCGAALESKSIKVYTDGSASLPTACQELGKETTKPTSSWGICYGNDWFKMCWNTIPPESLLAVHDVRGAVLVGDAIPQEFSTGIYMAELHAVVRALMSLPVTWHVTLVLDSKSSMVAVQRFGTCSTRAKLRMPGRPMLGMIERLTKDRVRCGGAVEWIHVKSHSDVMEENEAGNRCADFIAGKSRQAEKSVLEPLRLELGERWLYVTEEEGKVIYSDVRRAVISKCQDVNMELWRASPSQSTYADTDVLDLCSQVLNAESTMLCCQVVKFLMCVTTDTLQYVWIDGAAAGEKVQQRCCALCVDGILDVKHVLTCPAKDIERAALLSDAIKLLKPHVSESGLRHLLSVTCLKTWVGEVFFVSPTPPRDVCLNRVLFGGFSDSKCYKVLSLLGVKKRVLLKELTCDLRELMFVRCLKVWKSLC